MLKLLILPLSILLLLGFARQVVAEPADMSANMIKNQTITAYSSSIDETDDSPFIMANNKRVFYGAVANNCYDFGQVVNIMGYEFVVSDRKNSRYGCEWWDIWLPSKEEALKFGIWYNQV